MDKKTREAIGLLRHRIISPVLMDSGRAQMKYFREQAFKEFEVPGHGRQMFSASTMKGWLHDYRKHGFDGLVPQIRADAGQFRKLPDQLAQQVLKLREDLPDLSVSKFYRRCLMNDLLGVPPISQGTIHRFLKTHGCAKDRTPQARKRFEMSHFGELWTADFMHGPQVFEREGSLRKRKAILFAIIDDYSRVIVGGRFGVQENTLRIEEVLKEALIKFGLVERIYCDNGSSFSSDYFSKVCAKLGVGLIHSKPYDSPSRGKIERFFRTVREGFLVEIREVIPLEVLNEKFEQWLRDEYHYQHHAGIDCRPIDRYQISISRYPRPRVNLEKLEELFLVTAIRSVKQDATVSLNGVIYEVPAHMIGKKIELRYSQDTPIEVYLYKDDLRGHRLKQVDAKENGRLYRPKPKDTIIPFQKMIHSDEEEV